jgi:hypothetical protein
MLRSAMRLWPQVIDVRPVSKDNRQSIAESRIRSAVVDEMTPIFENLKDEIGHVLDSATDSFSVVAGEDEPTPLPTPLPEQRREPEQQRREAGA